MISSDDLVEFYYRDNEKLSIRPYKKGTCAEISINTFCNDLTVQ